MARLRARRRGFSIIELLVALIIIGILVTAITPRLANRTEEARLTRARQDLENIQNAQERVAVDIGYLVRLGLLDDVSGFGVTDGFPPQTPAAFNAGNTIDSLFDEGLAGSYFGNTDQFFIRLSDGQLESAAVGGSLLDRIATTNSETPFGQVRWAGPYLTYQVDKNHPAATPDSARTYIGDDPWGNDYLFFLPNKGSAAPGGLLLEPTGTVVTTSSLADIYNAIQPGSGAGLSTTQYDCNIFDRFTVLSLGLNGVPGNGGPATGPTPDGFGKGDDVFRQF